MKSNLIHPMKYKDWLLLFPCVVLACATFQTWADVPAASHTSFSAPPTDTELLAVRAFDEPLVPLNSDSNIRENQALAQALAAYASRATADDCSNLANFADTFPQSRWTASLLLHLGTEYYNYGYFSKALDAWQRAWVQFQNSTYAPAKPQADLALGELARMYSRLGRMSDLSALLKSTQDRDLAGPGSQLVHAASDSLGLMMNTPYYSFGCGPSALDRILLHYNPAQAGSPVLWDCKSGTNGFSLPQVAEISRKLGMNYQMAYRDAGAALILPSVVHWKVGHYAALIERHGDRILAQDYTFMASLWVSERALNAETSGYYLVPPGTLPAGWRSVSPAEGNLVWGKGPTDSKDGDGTSDCYDKTAGGTSCESCKNPCDHSDGMTTYTMQALLVSLSLKDTPLRFFTPFGPNVSFTASYHQLEANQPASFYYSNLGPKWNCNWLSYVTDNPTVPGSDISIYLDGGGTLRFNNFNPSTQSYAIEAMSQSVLVLLGGSNYELRYPNGSRREYSRSDGATGSTRRIFLTQVIDPNGNIVQLNYDGQLRITNVVNAIGQAMTFGYTNTAFPFAITSATDPFGRSAQLLYDSNGLLVQITDMLGLTSQYTYGANQFITALTTPYGVTTFATGTTNGGTFLTATDPLGATEALEYSQSLPVPHNLPASQVPHGLSTFNLFLDARDSFFWSKKAFAENPWDPSKSTVYHWLHQSPNGTQSSRLLESIKDPLTSRLWFNYPGQSTNFGAPYYLDAAYTGSSDLPSVVAQVMDDGTTQLSTYGYNAAGNLTNLIDPVGHTFSFLYASNNIDLLETRMTRNGKNELMYSATYDSRHNPLTLRDADGQANTITYGTNGQILTMTDSKNEAVTFNYDTNGFLTSIQGPINSSNDKASFTYDTFNRIQSITDTEGYVVQCSYDAFDRLVSKVYPDGTSEKLVYNRLDLAAIQDRLGRWTTNSYNANRQMVSKLDPLGRLTRFEWCKCGLLEGIIDPLGRETTFTYDIQSRPVAKQYPDGSMETYVYEPASGRLYSRSDANGLQTVMEYYPDGKIKRLSYPNSASSMPSVAYTYDPDYGRISSMEDGVGTTVYTYNPITSSPSLGASQLNTISGPLPNSTISFTYDELGRVASRTINGAVETIGYDQLGRTAAATNSLGAFQYAYLNATKRLSAIYYPNGQSTLYSYYDQLGDQRMKQILNLKANATVLSSFGYTYNTAGQIINWTNQWDTLPGRVWNFTYDAADQLVGAVRTDGINPVSTNSYTYDFAANRTSAVAAGNTNNYTYNALNEFISNGSVSNGISYEWDAARRLTAVNAGTHRSEFTYDGQDHRVRIVEKENGQVVADNRYLWCGNELCEERDSTGGVVLKRYFSEGESLLGTGGTTNLYYTRDHLGSVREAVDSAGTLQARYDYDPYGQQTVLAENIAPSFGFTGHFQHKPSGLYLAMHRALDPRVGRWLNRDPIGEAGGPNLYAYVDNNPVRFVDPYGLCGDSETEPGEQEGSFAREVADEELTHKEFYIENGIRFVEVELELHENLNVYNEPFDFNKIEAGPGTAVAVAGAAISTTLAVAEDYHNGAGVVLTATDAGATLSSDLVLNAAPPLALANAVTGGVISASIHNALATPNTIGKLWLGSANSGEQEAIKKIYTRNWLTKFVWRAGEWLADKIVSDYPGECP